MYWLMLIKVNHKAREEKKSVIELCGCSFIYMVKREKITVDEQIIKKIVIICDIVVWRKFIEKNKTIKALDSGGDDRERGVLEINEFLPLIKNNSLSFLWMYKNCVPKKKSLDCIFMTQIKREISPSCEDMLSGNLNFSWVF